MGLFSARRAGPHEFRLPIRLHSQLTARSVLHIIGRRAVAATNDPWIVGAILLLAAAALALEMAISFRL